MKSLQSTTRLPYSILSKALVGLTAEGQDLLLPSSFPSPPQEEKEKKKKSKFSRSKSSSKQNLEPVVVLAGWGRREDGEIISIKRFMPSASFTLNEKFIGSLRSGSR